MSHAPPPAPADTPELTVILPVFNEAPNLALLWPELIGILDAHWQRVEIIFVALPPYDGMHRFVPTLLRIAGYKVREVPVTHRPRRFGQSKFGVRNRAGRAFRDLLVVRWMQHRVLRYSVEPDA